jgi:rod shape-determining protein MreD
VNLYQATHAPAPASVTAELRLVAVYVAAAIVALLLQTTVLHQMTGGRVIPDLVLVLCVYLGLHEHSVAGVTGAFLLGYLLDSFSGSVVGLNAFAMTSVYVVVYLMSRRLWMDNVLSAVAMAFLGTVLKGVLVTVALAAYLAVHRPTLQAAQILLAEALLAAALTPVTFATLRRAKRLVGVA